MGNTSLSITWGRNKKKVFFFILHHFILRRGFNKMKVRLLIFALGTFAVGTELLVFAGILPSIAHDLHVSVPLTGQLITIYSLTYALASPILTALTGKIPPRRLLVGALTIFVVSNILSMLAPNFGVLVVARFLAGCAAAMYTPTASALAATMVSPEERGRALGIVFAGMAVSTVLGVPLGTFIGGIFGWRATFVVIAFLALLAIGGILTLVKETAPLPRSLRDLGRLLVNRRLVIALFIGVFQLVAQFTVYTYIAPLLLHTNSLNAASLSLILLLYGVAGVIGSSLSGYSADRWSTVGTIALCLAILALTLGTLSLVASSIIIVAIVIGLWGFVGLAFTPAQQRYLLTITPQAASVALALNASAVFLGQAAGAAIGGVVIQSMGIERLGFAGGLFALLSLIALILSTRVGLATSHVPNAPQHSSHEDNNQVPSHIGGNAEEVLPGGQQEIDG
jgi:multidrug resistance protein